MADALGATAIKADVLTINDDESVDCASCSKSYYLPSSLKRIAAVEDRRL